MDYSSAQGRELIDFYIDHYTAPSLEWFLYNYEKVDEAKQEHIQKEAAVAKRREETKRRLDEWRNRWQKN